MCRYDNTQLKLQDPLGGRFSQQAESRKMLEHCFGGVSDDLLGKAFCMGYDDDRERGGGAGCRSPGACRPGAICRASSDFHLDRILSGRECGLRFDDSSRFTLDPGNEGAFSVLGVSRPSGAKVSSDGFTGGGQIGYNYQFGGFGGGGIVAGIEADAAYTDINKTVDIAGPVGPQITSFHSKLDYLGTVRGRLGFAFDRTLVYATGGLAYGEVENSVTFFNNPNFLGGNARFNGGSDSVKTGWTAGGGVEYALPTNWFLNFGRPNAVTVKAEYLYYDLGTTSFALPATANGGSRGFYGASVRTTGNLARVGLNYKF